MLSLAIKAGEFDLYFDFSAIHDTHRVWVCHCCRPCISTSSFVRLHFLPFRALVRPKSNAEQTQPNSGGPSSFESRVTSFPPPI
ncbi:hypothetical protein CH063_16132 [Colletotrichum higginsianum]|uniref:Uncharacterized protein n=1 Tax=Colletotrichum higginsianum (strain IMI 349063) TaxID=759273 RepID=H1UV13_COLHI|nr:hypothetical protein CH063_16132 [Colletotrichum higginsianum]